jgi:hypothetical protein
MNPIPQSARGLVRLQPGLDQRSAASLPELGRGMKSNRPALAIPGLIERLACRRPTSHGKDCHVIQAMERGPLIPGQGFPDGL